MINYADENVTKIAMGEIVTQFAFRVARYITCYFDVQTNRTSKTNLVGSCEIDLSEIFSSVSCLITCIVL